jgi:hypothetical protein
MLAAHLQYIACAEEIEKNIIADRTLLEQKEAVLSNALTEEKILEALNKGTALVIGSEHDISAATDPEHILKQMFPLYDTPDLSSHYGIN